LRLADLLDDVVDIGNTLGIELRPVVQAANDIGAGAGLDRRGGARLQIVAVDRLEIELMPRAFSASGAISFFRSASDAGTKSFQRSQ
jgi:hypothetical protein